MNFMVKMEPFITDLKLCIVLFQKVSGRDRHSTNTRRGSYNHDRVDHHGDREGIWNVNSKSRVSGRMHNRQQAEKSNSRPDRLAGTESRADRPLSSHMNDTFPSYQAQNGPVRSNSTRTGSSNLAYGMYPLPAMNPSGMSSNGPTMPPVFMFYPYDHNAAYGSPSEQLEFGSLGPVSPVGFSGVNDVSQLSEGSRSGGTFEEQRFPGSSPRHSSPDQLSPHVQRYHLVCLRYLQHLFDLVITLGLFSDFSLKFLLIQSSVIRLEAQYFFRKIFSILLKISAQPWLLVA